MRKLFYILLAVSLAGCDVLYPSLMLKTPKDYKFAELHDSTSSTNYRISRNDFLNMRLFSQDGQHIIDLTNTSENGTSSAGGSGGGGSSSAVNTGVDYLVQADGTVKLPVIGNMQVMGLNIRQATEMLEQKYSQFFIKPYILMSVDNRRVIVFPGDPGTARVIPLINNNTTVIEALALAGGLTEAGKAKEIKLIRGDPANPEVYLFDLSKIEGIKEGNTILQANDIIYVTPQRRPSLALLERITPFLTAITTILLTYAVIRNSKF